MSYRRTRDLIQEKCISPWLVEVENLHKFYFTQETKIVIFTLEEVTDLNFQEPKSLQSEAAILKLTAQVVIPETQLLNPI